MPGILRDQEREERMERRENERDKKFLSHCRFCRSDPRFDRSGLTGMIKERGHQINDQKCSRLKSRYLTILMELLAEIL